VARGGGPHVEAITASLPKSPLLEEATRELHAMRASSYTHTTEVDEENGVFDFDCSGFVSYVLRVRAPDALAAIPVGPKGRVRAEDYVAYFCALDDASSSPWMRLDRASALRGGDVIAWLRAEDSGSKSTGHVAVVAAQPTRIAPSDPIAAIGGAEEWLVRVIDSTESPHADDARADDHKSGLGEGTIGIILDESGAAIGFRWKGGVSSEAHATTIAMARLR
jgi:hypothetical protein